MAESKFVKANEKIAEAVVDGYQKIESGVVGGYKKIEEGVVSGFGKITDKFVGEFLTREGESVEEAKARLAAEETARQEAAKVEAEKRAAAHPIPEAPGGDIAKASVEASLERARSSVEASRNAGRHHT